MACASTFFKVEYGLHARELHCCNGQGSVSFAKMLRERSRCGGACGGMDGLYRSVQAVLP